MANRFPKAFPVIFFWLIIAFIPAYSQSDDLASYIHRKHGYDHNLINGILYYEKYKQVLHHPFYKGKEFLPGSVVISGKTYEDLQINYDIYSQYLILEYPGISGSSYRIIISPEHTDAFYLEGNYFEKLTLDDRGPLFYQLIRVNGITCYIHWKKKKVTRSYQFSEYFTEPDQRFFLDYDGRLSPFSSKRSFASLVSGVPRKEVRGYFRKHEIRLAAAKPRQLEELLKFIYERTEPSGN